jgi:hypothetical protein
MMATVAVNVHRRNHSHELEADLRRARVLAQILDAQFSIAGIRFGADALVGLIPGFGDAAALLTSLYPLYLLRKHKLHNKYSRRMIANIAIDFLGGLVPVAGDLFDIYFKANLKNLALLERAAAERSG